MQGDDPLSDDSEREEHQTGPKSGGPMKGMHIAMMQGWIVQRARDKCSFFHDRHRQAADAYRDGLPKEAQQEMFLKVISATPARKPH
jgi:hypothetical protein